jgi:phosphoserine phosphatase
MLADYYGFDDAAGSKYEVKEGRFTGQADVLLGKRKPESLAKMVSEHGADRINSIGVGDSEGDIALLSSVDQAIAFNPTRELFEYAREKDWKVVVERKNVVYELTKNRDGYRLLRP